MDRVKPQFSERAVDGCEVFTVPGPDMLREQLIPLNPSEGEHTGASVLGTRLGVVPARASLSRWRTEGYPIDKGGPKVLLPYVTRLKRVYTSVEALTRWLATVQYLGQEIRDSGGVSRWRNARQ